nr:ribonuclease H-like domain-containing protein [Tanacetum cinerariifolium]
FSVSNSEGLHKGYDRFQSILSQLETHGVGVSTEDANQKFLSTNEVNIAYGGSTSSCHNSQKEGSSSYTDDLMYSFFVNQSSGPQLDHEDIEHVDEFDLEEMDLKWQVAMISTRLKKFYKKTGQKLHFDAKEPVGFNKSKVDKWRDAGNTGYKARDNGKRPAKQDEHKAMVTVDGEGVDWTSHAEDETKDYALMAYNSNNSGSDTEVTSCSKVCKESYAKLKKLYDEQREQLGVARI